MQEAIPALINAGGVLFGVVACYSVLATQILGGESAVVTGHGSDVFHSFMSSFIALLRIACGDSWATTISREAEQDGFLAYPMLLSFIIVVRVLYYGALLELLRAWCSNIKTFFYAQVKVIILNLCLLVIATASAHDEIDTKGADIARKFRSAWVKLDPAGFGCISIFQV